MCYQAGSPAWPQVSWTAAAGSRKGCDGSAEGAEPLKEAHSLKKVPGLGPEGVGW